MDRYLQGVATLRLDVDRCSGCAMCRTVCPQRVWELSGGKAAVTDLDGCMECGACAVNCPEGAINVRKGVGCAAAIITSALGRKQDVCC